MPDAKLIARRLIWPVYLAFTAIYITFDVLNHSPLRLGEVVGRAIGSVIAWPLIIGAIAWAAAKLRRRPFAGTKVMVVSIVFAAMGTAQVIKTYYESRDETVATPEEAAKLRVRLAKLETPMAKAFLKLEELSSPALDQADAVFPPLKAKAACTKLREILPLPLLDRLRAVEDARACLAKARSSFAETRVQIDALFDAYEAKSQTIADDLPTEQRKRFTQLLSHFNAVIRERRVKELDLSLRILTEFDATLIFIEGQTGAYQMTDPRGFTNSQANAGFQKHLDQLKTFDTEADALDDEYRTATDDLGRQAEALANAAPGR